MADASRPVEIRSLEATEVERAAAMLARAFLDDPLLAYVVPAPHERTGAYRALFTGLLRYGLRYGRVWTTPGLEGVAIRRVPGDVPSPWGRIVRSGLAALPLRLGAAATTRLLRVMHVTEAAALRHMRGPFWYCQVLGVDPDRQGQGFGKRLTHHTFAQAERDGLPCYLETATPRSRAIHERNGWTTIEPFVAGTVTVWSMQRPPGAARVNPP